MSDALSRALALLFARLVLGLIFFMAGFWKTFHLGPAGIGALRTGRAGSVGPLLDRSAHAAVTPAR